MKVKRQQNHQDYYRGQKSSARERKIVRHLPLVKYVIARMFSTLPAFVDRDDLFQAGMVGLIQAVDSFDSSRSVKLESYAIPRIRGAILDSLRELDWAPRSVRRKTVAAERAIDQLESELGRTPSEEEVASKLNITKNHLIYLLQKYNIKKVPIDYDTPIKDRDWLYQKYITENLNMKEIATIIGCDINNVSNSLKRANIKSKRLGRKSKYKELNDPEWLLNMYWGKKELSLVAIARIIGCDSKLVLKALREFNIKTRNNSESQKGRKNHQFGKVTSDEEKDEISKKLRGRKQSEEHNHNLSKTKTKQWQNPDFIKKMIKSTKVKPNKPEQKIDEILQRNFSNEWKYNGDFSCGVTIGGLVPDFVNVNGKKAVIEVFGEVWHDTDNTFLKRIRWKQTEFGRKAIYSQFGYKCIIIWVQAEIMKENAEEIVLSKIKREL